MKSNSLDNKDNNLEKIMSSEDGDSLFMKFLKYILLNLTFTLNVSIALFYAQTVAFNYHTLKMRF